MLGFLITKVRLVQLSLKNKDEIFETAVTLVCTSLSWYKEAHGSKMYIFFKFHKTFKMTSYHNGLEQQKYEIKTINCIECGLGLDTFNFYIMNFYVRIKSAANVF